MGLNMDYEREVRMFLFGKITDAKKLILDIRSEALGHIPGLQKLLKEKK